LIPPFFLDCVVAIGYRPPVAVSKQTGGFEVGRRDFVPVGSGFLYGHLVKKADNGPEYRIFLVTNDHVLEDVERVQRRDMDQLAGVIVPAELPPLGLNIRFNPRVTSKAAQDFWLPLRNPLPHNDWVRDKENDLAVLGINWQVLDEAGIQYHYFQSDEHVADRSKAGELGILEGDVTYVLGFPMGLVGGERNFVIARQGAIARIRDCLASTTSRFLIDSLVFPGNSGGPVVTRPELTAIQGTKRQDRAYLIGVVRAYVPYQDVAVSQQTGRARIAFEENSGLAEVIPMDFVKKLIEQYEARPRPK
jgi:S1-C subfamily serine protease